MEEIDIDIQSFEILFELPVNVTEAARRKPSINRDFLIQGGIEIIGAVLIINRENNKERGKCGCTHERLDSFCQILSHF